MQSDQRHPGCAVIRAAFGPPRSTTSIFVLSGVRVSSGLSKLFAFRLAMTRPSRDVVEMLSEAIGSPSLRAVILVAVPAAVQVRDATTATRRSIVKSSGSTPAPYSWGTAD